MQFIVIKYAVSAEVEWSNGGRIDECQRLKTCWTVSVCGHVLLVLAWQLREALLGWQDEGGRQNGKGNGIKPSMTQRKIKNNLTNND